MAARPAQGVPAEGTGLSERAGRDAEALRPLPRAFFARRSPVVARDLLGRLLVRRLPDGVRLVARIVECEAYQEDDPASHSYRGMTDRNRVMFGPPGHLYVYFSYGMHWCMNVVTGRDGEGSAVLLRAAEPLQGVDRMRAHRRQDDVRLLCAGPGRLTQALAISSEHGGADLVRGPDLLAAAGSALPDEHVARGPRVGISVARDVPWRFVEAGSAFASRGSERSRRGAVAAPEVP